MLNTDWFVDSLEFEMFYSLPGQTTSRSTTWCDVTTAYVSGSLWTNLAMLSLDRLEDMKTDNSMHTKVLCPCVHGHVHGSTWNLNWNLQTVFSGQASAGSHWKQVLLFFFFPVRCGAGCAFAMGTLTAVKRRTEHHMHAPGLHCCMGMRVVVAWLAT